MNKRSTFAITLPATSANIGPAFDTAAIAMELLLHVQAETANQFSISAIGHDTEIVGSLKNNLIIKTYKQVLKGESKPSIPLSLRIKNEMPIGKGCGSSAAARLAGIALAVHFGGLNWDDEHILAEACHRENHPDNAVACWLGGLTVARLVSSENKRATLSKSVKAISIKPAILWPLMLVVPKKSLPTGKSRAVLPVSYSRSETVANLQNVALLVGAFATGRGDLLAHACSDHIHEPYRSQLCPLLGPLRTLSGKHGILGATLSGSGPSVLLFLDPHRSMRSIRNRVQKTLRHHILDAELIYTSIRMAGAQNSRTPTASFIAKTNTRRRK